MVAHVELYQGGGVTRSAAVLILLVTGVTVRRHLTSRSLAATLILVVTSVRDCRRELIQHLYYQRVMFMTGLRLCLKPHSPGKGYVTHFVPGLRVSMCSTVTISILFVAGVAIRRQGLRQPSSHNPIDPEFKSVCRGREDFSSYQYHIKQISYRPFSFYLISSIDGKRTYEGTSYFQK